MTSFVRALSIAISGLALSACGSAKTPDAVKNELAGGPADTTTIVAFTDYECPYCKAAHAELVKALSRSPGLKYRVVRHHVPLPSHPHAELAARAAICVETLGGRTDRMDDALFNAGSARLDPGTCEDSAAEAGVDRDAFKTCLTAPATDARLRKDIADYMQTSASGVPLHFVGKTRFEGAQDATVWQEALEAARASK
jgi:protein-disulfide isomerase